MRISDQSSTGDDLDRDIEQMVQDAIGNSVTPSRLLESRSPHLLDRVIGREKVPGPAISFIESSEQPHYLLKTNPGGYIAENDTSIDNFNGFKKYFNEIYTFISDAERFSSALLVITDQSILLAFENGSDTQVHRIGYNEVNDASYTKLTFQYRLKITTSEKEYVIIFTPTNKYTTEISDAATYIFGKIDSDGNYAGYDYSFHDNDDFKDAKEELKNQLHKIQGVAEEVDSKRVIMCAGKGAKLGAYRSPYGAIAGFFLGAGYAILTDQQTDGTENNPSVDVANIDPDRTAETIFKWQNIGRQIESNNLELATGAIGAAIALDEQLDGPTRIPFLSELDIEQVSRQLEEGEVKATSLAVARETVDQYTQELAELLEDDIFNQL